ncbi:hypothetical protein JMM81_17075 [Bacillus sp. V3B]|uniref:hypothetical protein n=1 Tax=Bacillus sp. V3B TaxID=2804915 RepID=UPI00210C94BF|nr:hypothetical protein [Bacillus sp. V3B]MCQ6276628.1 hypothetical protein [Bacillus sp. V3B]
MSKKKQKIFKYNQDDILEILTEHLAEEGGFDTFQSKAILLGTPDKDLRLITVIGELDDDGITDIDLDEIDKSMDYNGSHSDLDERFYLNRNDKK